MTNSNDKNLDALEAIFDEVALVEAEDGVSTPEEQRWAQQVRARLEQRVASMRENLAGAPTKRAQPIHAKYLAMARDALIAAVEAVLASGRVQVAHRNLSALSDDDLRRLLQSLDPDSD